jgi:hypothetical protein
MYCGVKYYKIISKQKWYLAEDIRIFLILGGCPHIWETLLKKLIKNIASVKPNALMKCLTIM